MFQHLQVEVYSQRLSFHILEKLVRRLQFCMSLHLQIAIFISKTYVCRYVKDTNIRYKNVIWCASSKHYIVSIRKSSHITVIIITIWLKFSAFFLLNERVRTITIQKILKSTRSSNKRSISHRSFYIRFRCKPVPIK